MLKENKMRKGLDRRDIILAGLWLIFLFFFSGPAEFLNAVPAGLSEKYIMVEGKPFIIKGAAYTLSYPERNHYTQIPVDVFAKDLKMMKEAGINTIKTYDVPPPFFLDLVEEYGLKIIVQVDYVGYWTKYNSAKERKAVIEEAVLNVKANKDRKCILMWAIWNDAPFIYNVNSRDVVDEFGMAKVNSFLKAVYLAVKKADPSRPITGSNMLNFNGSSLGFDFLDVISFNAYFGITDWNKGKFDPEKARDTVVQIRNLTAPYKKPVLISETGYSTYHTELDQGTVLKEQVRAIGTNFSGVVIFQWSDEWGKAGNYSVHDNNIEEHWGILDGYRNPKTGYQALKALWGK
ncbi:MAG: glycoside hydrolase family 2 TIM barrel-domain containing protein [bacterium]|nr:glycoside hydrolase family 2 TIM barrel-domain containing protein [bacterium]